MAVYSAWCDRVPEIAIGGNELDAAHRPSGVPTIHSAQDINADRRPNRAIRGHEARNEMLRREYRRPSDLDVTRDANGFFSSRRHHLLETIV